PAVTTRLSTVQRSSAISYPATCSARGALAAKATTTEAASTISSARPCGSSMSSVRIMSPVRPPMPVPNRSRTLKRISARVHSAHASAASDAPRRQARPAGDGGRANTAAARSHPTASTAAMFPPSSATERPILVSAPVCERPGAAVSLNAPPSRTTRARTTSAMATAPMASIGLSVGGAYCSRVVTAGHTHPPARRVQSPVVPLEAGRPPSGEQAAEFVDGLAEAVGEDVHRVGHPAGRAQVGVEAVREQHVGDADALVAGRSEAEVPDVDGRGRAGAQVVVAHDPPAGGVEQRERLGDAQLGAPPLLDQLELPEVLLGGPARLAVLGAAHVGLGGGAERGPAGLGAGLRVLHGLHEAQHLRGDDAHGL